MFSPAVAETRDAIPVRCRSEIRCPRRPSPHSAISIARAMFVSVPLRVKQVPILAYTLARRSGVCHVSLCLDDLAAIDINEAASQYFVENFDSSCHILTMRERAVLSSGFRVRRRPLVSGEIRPLSPSAGAVLFRLAASVRPLESLPAVLARPGVRHIPKGIQMRMAHPQDRLDT